MRRSAHCFTRASAFKDGTKYFQKGVAIGERLVAEYPAVPRYRSALADVSLQLAGNRMATGLADEALVACSSIGRAERGIGDRVPRRARLSLEPGDRPRGFGRWNRRQTT